MRQLILATLLLAGLAARAAAAPPAEPRQAPAFNPAQRAEIVQILRDALRSDPSILRDAAAALQQDEARQQGEATQTALASERRALTENSADPVAGAAAGDVTVVEFYDTRCPYCRRMLPTLAALLKADPKLRLVYKDLPILGPNSMLEARALLAAQRQGGYGAMQEAVMHATGPATVQSLRAQAAALGLDGAKLQQDMADPAIQARIDATLQLAQKLHVEGTPAFVIGNQIIPGAIALPELQGAVAIARQQ